MSKNYQPTGDSFEDWKRGHYNMMFIDEEERYERFVKRIKVERFVAVVSFVVVIFAFLWVAQVI